MGVRQRLRYRFDNLMARGVGAQILLLAVFTALLIGLTVLLMYVLHVVPADDQGVHDSSGKVVWRSVNRVLDPGHLASDSGSGTFLFSMLVATLGGGSAGASGLFASFGWPKASHTTWSFSVTKVKPCGTDAHPPAASAEARTNAFRLLRFAFIADPF